MLLDDATAYVRAVLSLELLPFDDAMAALVGWARRGGEETLREHMVRDGFLSEEEALTAARAVVARLSSEVSLV